MSYIIDTHTHLYAEQFDTDRSEMISRALEVGVKEMHLPNIDLASIAGMHELCDTFPDHVFPMMGLHPCSVKEDFNQVLDQMEMHFDKRKYYGIGETGIDLYWDKSTKDWQIESFERQIDWAKQKQLPIVIHSRAALDLTIQVISDHQDGTLAGIFHCFDGNVEQAKKIIDLGFYLGIGGVVTFKKSPLPDVIKEIGLSNVVLETDSPYLSPMPKRGKRNESAHLVYIAEFLGDQLNLKEDRIAEVTSNNAKKIFKR